MKIITRISIELLLLVITIYEIKADEICDAIIIDAITTLQNGTIVIFRRSEVWLLHKDRSTLLGPCPVSTVYEEMKGPVDAAITITAHDSITQFVGSSIYFENGNYLTYRNLGQYKVEWGALIYLPHKGLQTQMGSTVPEAAKLMKTKMSAAYFDPIDHKSKFVFPDGTILEFTFELGAEYDTPLVSSLESELKKYGIEKVPPNVSAALTLANANVHELYLFDGSSYCSFELNPSSVQKCEWKPIKDGFLNCNQIVRSNGFCAKPVMNKPKKDVPEKSIEVKDELPEGNANEGNTKQNSQITGKKAVPHARADTNPEKIKAKSSGNSLLLDSILCFLNFLFLFYTQIYC